jgi:hypothetical protein
MKLFRWYKDKKGKNPEIFFAYRRGKYNGQDGWDILIREWAETKWMRSWIPADEVDLYVEATSFKLNRIESRVLIRRIFWFKSWET